MAGSSAIGSVFVSLGLDSAQFTQGLKKAQGSLSDFSKVAVKGLAVAATGAVAVGAALGLAVKSAIDYADSIDDASQKTGVAADALSRLAYVAKIEGVGLDGLTAGLQKLSVNLAAIAQGSKGPAATALSALGVSATDANGRLRESDEVLVDIADKFSRMQDSSTKTALAVALFGKSGAELIPLLNYGADGLKRMADESDRLGQTVSASTAAAAGRFNDTLTKLGATLQGVALKVAEAALPALQKFADFIASPQFAEAATTLGSALVGAFDLVVQAVVGTTNAIQGFLDWIAGLGSDAGAGSNQPLTDFLNADSYNSLVSGLNQSSMRAANPGYAEDVYGAAADPYAGFNFDDSGKFIVAVQQATDETVKFTAAKKGLTDAEKAHKQAMEEGLQVLQDTRSPFEEMQMEFDKLGALLNQGAIDWETYGRAAGAAQGAAVASTIGMVADMTDALSQSFEDSKVLSIATAVLKGAESIASSFAAGSKIGGPVLGSVFAGIAAVTAAANVAAVAAVSSTSKSMGGSKGGAASVPSAPTSPVEAAASQSVNVTLQGQSYGRDQIRDLLEQIGSALGDGMTLKVT